MKGFEEKGVLQLERMMLNHILGRGIEQVLEDISKRVTDEDLKEFPFLRDELDVRDLLCFSSSVL